MGAPKSRAREVTRAVMLPTGAHGLVARPYEPLADSRAGTHGPTKPVPCSRFREHSQAPEGLTLHSAYLISTLAPASSSFFLRASASALLMPSFTGFGAPSTRSFASFRPRPVTSRTALIEFTLFSPA